MPLLGICPKELKSGCQKDIGTPTSVAALFTTAKMWKQPKCPLTEEWMKKMWYIHAMRYYVALKRKFQPVLQHGRTLKTPCEMR